MAIASMRPSRRSGTAVLRQPERDVGRGDHVAGFYGVEGLGAVPRFPRDTGGRSEGDCSDAAVSVGGPEHGQPWSGPVEARRIGDRDESEPAQREPLAPNRPGLRVAFIGDRNLTGIDLQDGCEASRDGALHPSARLRRDHCAHDCPSFVRVRIRCRRAVTGRARASRGSARAEPGRRLRAVAAGVAG